MSDKIMLWWKGTGFGEPLILSMVTNILRDNGIDAIFYEHWKVKDLVDCELIPSKSKDYRGYKKHNWWYSIETAEPIINQYINHYSELLGKKLEITRNHIPVKYHDNPKIKGVDVAIHPLTGEYTPYRNWPYFPALKALLHQNNITFTEIDTRKIWGIDFLNYVNKSKIYLGLETGPSHYVSQFMRDRAIILQGGFSTFDFWAGLYGYEYIQIDNVPCRPCFLSWKDILAGNKCKYSNRCMNEIDPLVVFDKIKEML